MNLQSTFTVYRKELKDILRDRRTLMSMILFPILIIPVLYLGLGTVMQKRVTALKEKRSVVTWIAPREADELKRAVAASGGVDLITGPADTAAAIELLEQKDIDAVVFVAPGFKERLEAVIAGGDAAEPPVVEIFVDETRQSSEFAASKLIAVFRKFRTDFVSRVLSERGMRPELVRPFGIMQRNVASPEKMGRAVTGFILPYMVILMVLTGAMYPAIDLTAGEKERGAKDGIQAFRKFLEKLNTDSKYDALTVFGEALDFIKGFGLNAKALSENPPLFYGVFTDGISFFWPSGMMFVIRLQNFGTPKEPKWVINWYFDHLARTEVIE